jgi:hypothetical protein
MQRDGPADSGCGCAAGAAWASLCFSCGTQRRCAALSVSNACTRRLQRQRHRTGRLHGQKQQCQWRQWRVFALCAALTHVCCRAVLPPPAASPSSTSMRPAQVPMRSGVVAFALAIGNR